MRRLRHQKRKAMARRVLPFGSGEIVALCHHRMNTGVPGEVPATDKNVSKGIDRARVTLEGQTGLYAGRGSGSVTAAQESMVMAAKKAPNPIDKHVGSRVRMRRMML